MRILVVGGGEIGYELARDLSSDYALTVVDIDSAVAKRFDALDIGFVTGSGASADVLHRAGVAQTDLLIACTGLDEVNMVTCAVAMRLGCRRTICVVSREELIGDGSSAAAVRSHFGIDRIVWPESQLAEEMVRIICSPGAIDAEEFADGRVRLLEFKLGPGSPLVNAPLAALPLPHGVLVVAVKRGAVIEIPRGTTQLAVDDKVFVMGTVDAMSRVVPLVHAGTDVRAPQRVTIIGGGDVGLRIAQRLEETDVEVRIIERDPQRGADLAAALRRTLVLNGDGTDLELLESENIGGSDVLVSVIDNDERNLFASLLGRQLGVSRIITRVGRSANLRLFERVGIDVALSARGAAVKSLVHDIRGGRAHLLAVLEEGQATIVEVTVPPGVRPTALADLVAPPHSIVGAILRGREVVIPRGADQIRAQDRLIVFAAADAVHRVRDYFGTV
jgi:trk system potassium uptake protein TrkA